MLKLSASSIDTFYKCPKKYQYRYIIKPDVPETDWSFLEFGKCAHRVLELFHEYLMKNVVEPSEYALIMRNSFKEAIKEFNQVILRPDFAELKQVLQDYLDVIKKEGLPPVIHNELSFKFEIGGHLVRGYIDRVDKIGPGEYKIVDYKTNKNPKFLKSFQLILYALAIKEIYPDAETIHGSFVLLKHKSKTKDWTFTEKDYEKVRSEIINAGTDIVADNKWIKKPSRLCDWCDYQLICEGKWV